MSFDQEAENTVDELSELDEQSQAVEANGAQEGSGNDVDDAADANNVENEQEGQLSDEELDKIADTAIETLRGILKHFDAGDAEIDEYEGDEGELILDVVGANLAVLIGRYGKTLDSLQFVVAAVVNKRIGFRYPIVVDIEGYRHRRRQKLESMAKSSATRCIRNQADVRLRPMTPYERRIIHIILRDERRVFTESEGEEPNRLIVIRPSR